MELYTPWQCIASLMRTTSRALSTRLVAIPSDEKSESDSNGTASAGSPPRMPPEQEHHAERRHKMLSCKT